MRTLSRIRCILFPPPTPFKHGIKHAEDRHRLNMLSIAARSVPDSRVSRVEIERKGLSYTLDTLKYFHAAYPGSRLYWVIGDDNLDMLDKSKGYPEHFRYAGFIVLPRRHEEDLQERIDAHPYGDRLHPLDAGILPLASTDIRRRIARGEPVSGLLPGAVNDYIQKNGLYR
ncbi:MAG: hypothetical protein U5N26_08965 [Candidatus Marinimicrobia bacterium]|nr:hypothetical protein [Candidatus Neomarinimicrobiota bacterium]